MAGESAREQAERQRANAERLTRAAAQWETGAEGEAGTGRALDELTRSPGWTVLHDVPWPGRQQVNLDHVAIGPSGVFVIDSKNWSGEITVEGEELRANGWSRADAVRDAVTAAQALGGALPGAQSPGLIQPVLCFVRDEWVSERIGDVLICSSQNVVAQLKTRRHVLDSATVERLAADLTHVLEAAVEPVEPVEPVESVEPERAVLVVSSAVPQEETSQEETPQEATPPFAGRHSRSTKRLFRPARAAQVVAGLGLLAVVAFSPGTLQPVGTLVSDMFVQEADADNGDSPTEPTAEPKQAKDNKASNEPNAKASNKANKQKKEQRG